ncbi:MAG: ACP S-malonyltransferase [Spirulina sp. SIO3F2]|nr:ACP S-malonyltransferase [Spirulina sp. SIO3F2]
MTKTAWVFPGQGSQKVGMIADLLEAEAAQARLAEAEAILGWSVVDVTQGEESQLSQTLYTQPCLYTVETILVDALLENGQQPALMAGHSLGEYVALYGAKVFDFATGLKLVKQRAELMSQATGGTMMAMIGFDREQLNQVIEQTPDVVLANDNSDGQAVISGTPEAVEAVAEAVKTKRAIPLTVSGAFHSPMMADAAKAFDAVLADVAFQDAQVPVLSNVDPTPETGAAALKTRLSQQITGSVRWREIMAQIEAQGVEKVIEVGPGNVLTGLFKRSHKAIARANVASFAACAG